MENEFQISIPMVEKWLLFILNLPKGSFLLSALWSSSFSELKAAILEYFKHLVEYIFLFLSIHLTRISEFSGFVLCFYFFRQAIWKEVFSSGTRSSARKCIFKCLDSSRMV